jgi:hypothetical protein
MGDRKLTVRPFVLTLVVAAIAATVFAPAISGTWIYDDRPLIAENPYIHSFSWFTRWFTTDFWDVNEEIVRFGRRMVYWRPAITTTYAVDWQLGGGSPLVFHITNTLQHAVVGALAFVVLRRWLDATWPAFVAALLFAVHPTKAESVAWIAGRTDVVCMIAVLVATIGIGRRLRGERYGIALEIVGTALAYMSKEQAIVLPVFVAVEVWVHAGRTPIDWPLFKRAVIAALPQLGVAVGYLLVRKLVMPIEASMIGRSLLPADHVLAVLETFGRFFTLTGYPHELSIQHGLVQVEQGQIVHSTPYAIIGGVGLALLIAAAIVARKRWPVATVGIGFYLTTLLPTSNIKYTQMATLVSERFLYLPVLGLALVAGAALARLDGTRARVGYAVLAACIVATSWLALDRSSHYSDERTFWAREQELHWDSREARNFKLYDAQTNRKFQTALQILLEMKEVEYKHNQADDLAIGYQVAQTLSQLVPDHDYATLRSIEQFCADLVERKKPTAELRGRGLHVAMALQGESYRKQLVAYHPRILALRADVLGRLGDDKAAVEVVKQARALCAQCTSVFISDTVAHARAGDYAEARRIIASVEGKVFEKALAELKKRVEKAAAAHDQIKTLPPGPAQLQAQAVELSALELWGRAYDVLAPYKDDIKRAPGIAKGFAELAFRAGEPRVAKEVLDELMPAHEVNAQLWEWSEVMGWSE